MRPRWEDEAFAAGRRVAIIGADDSIRYATCAAELEPVETTRLSRAELSQAQRFMWDFDRRRAA